MIKTSTLPTWLRILIPTLLLIIWLGIGGVGGPYFGKISEVVTNNQTTFLPSNAESTEVSKRLGSYLDNSSIPLIIVISQNNSSLPQTSLLKAQSIDSQLTTIQGIKNASPVIPSQDGKAALIVANVNTSAPYPTVSNKVLSLVKHEGLTTNVYLTGPVGFLNDLTKAFAGIDGILLGVALAIVFIILLLVYRSPFLPFIVLLNSIFALSGAILIVFYLAKAAIITINGQVQGILFILVIGAATDYSLLLVARYREELTHREKPYQALLSSLKRAVEPIAAAGGTVIAGLLCLLFSGLNSNKALGPVGAIGIAVAMIATLTFLPSLLVICGRGIFWPRIPHFNAAKTASQKKTGFWEKIAEFITRRYRSILLVTVSLLLIATLGLFKLHASGVSQSDLILGSSEARKGQQVINAHFPGGSGTPAYVITKESTYQKVAKVVSADQGVAMVSASSKSSPSGTVPVSTPSLHDPTIVAGTVLLQVTLKDSGDSLAAQHTIGRLRPQVKSIDSSALIGGTAAVQLDTNLTAQRDEVIVIPIILGVITLILMLLLRSLLAPVLLLLTTVLSFGATLGISALIFNYLFHFPGGDPSIILYGFVFLVALGIDYNIFLMTRVREESLKQGTRKGVIIGLVVTGGVITSAGVVLAATFAALAVIPILFLAQLAFIVAFGVLLDTIVVRTLLVPSLITWIGHTIWWPSHAHKK